MDEDDGWTTAGSGGGEVQETMENQRSRRGACESIGRGMCAWSGEGEEDEYEADVTRCNAACSFFTLTGLV